MIEALRALEKKWRERNVDEFGSFHHLADELGAILATASEQASVADGSETSLSGLIQGVTDAADYLARNPSDEYALRHLKQRCVNLRLYPAHTSEARDAVLRGVRELALKAAAHWDSDEDMKVGKTLMALAGQLPNYDKRADAFDAAMRQEAE